MNLPEFEMDDDAEEVFAYAAAIKAGLLQNPRFRASRSDVHEVSVDFADALLAKLEDTELADDHASALEIELLNVLPALFAGDDLDFDDPNDAADEALKFALKGVRRTGKYLLEIAAGEGDADDEDDDEDDEDDDEDEDDDA